MTSPDYTPNTGRPRTTATRNSPSPSNPADRRFGSPHPTPTPNARVAVNRERSVEVGP